MTSQTDQLTDSVRRITAIAEEGSEEVALALAEEGWILLPKTSYDEFFAQDDFTPEQSLRTQAFINYLVEKERALSAKRGVYAQGDRVEISVQGDWTPGLVSAVTEWGSVEVETERGPKSLPKNSLLIRHVLVAPVA